jgi:radical SAM mobile pair protein B
MKEILIKEIEVKNIMTKSSLPTGGYSVNPYIGCTHACKYCYASFMKRFTKHTEDWGTFLDVKHWPKIKNLHKYDGEHIFIGSVTDGYQPQEEQFCRTRTLLEELQDSSAKIVISTKSDLVLRDLDILTKMKDVTVSWSINTLDETFKNEMDKAVSIERRLNAMKKVYDAGIRTACFISPVFPGITDVPAIIERVMNQCDFIWIENLNLRGSFKSDIMQFIKEKHPELMNLYDEIYNKKDRTYFDNLGVWIQNYCQTHGNPYEDNYLPDGKMPSGKPMLINYLFHEEIKNSNNNGTRKNNCK